MSHYLSEKLKVLSFFCIILVLYIHSQFNDFEISPYPAAKTVQGILSGILGKCAVPMFYVISGWLFFRSLPEGLSSVWAKMKKRAKTLLVPYLVGCAACTSFYMTVAVIPGTSKYMNFQILQLFNVSIGEIIYSIFYLPIAYPLWFLRDLILLVATAPLWYFALRYLKWGFVAAALALTFFDTPHVPALALFWFTLGGQLTTLYVESRSFTRLCIGGVYISNPQRNRTFVQ